MFLKIKLLATKDIKVKIHHHIVKKMTNFLINRNVGRYPKTSIQKMNIYSIFSKQKKKITKQGLGFTKMRLRKRKIY